jgi:hypothetical protein
MYTQKKPIENTHIVRERDRQRFRELLAVFVLGLPVGLFLLVFTWQNLEVIRLGHEATRLQKTRTELENVHKDLQFQIDRLTSLDAVEQKATTLGFRPTDPLQLVVVSNDPSVQTRPVAPSGVVTPDLEVAQPLVTQPVASVAPGSSRDFARNVPGQRDESVASMALPLEREAPLPVILSEEGWVGVSEGTQPTEIVRAKAVAGTAYARMETADRLRSQDSGILSSFAHAHPHPSLRMTAPFTLHPSSAARR